MKQTNKDGWVYIVQHSEMLYFQILDVPDRAQQQQRWVRLLLRLLKAGSKLYGL